MDATKNIRIKTIVDNSQGVQLLDAQGNAIKRVEQELSKTAVTAQGQLSPALNVSRRDMGLLAAQMLTTTGVTGRLGGQLSNLATGLATGGAIGAAFAGFAALINYISTESEEAKKATDALIGSLKEVIKVQAPGGFINIDPAKIPEAIALLKKERAEQMEFAKDWLKENSKGLQVYDESIKLLEEMNVKEEQRVRIVELLTAAGLTYTETLKEQVTLYETIADIIESDIMKAIEAMDDVLLGDVSTRGHRANQPRGPASRNTKASKGLFAVDERSKQDMEQFAQTSASIFTSNMNQAWENIFGEANSMFEQMLSAWQGMLFEKIGFGIFNMLFGGMDLFGFARNLTAGNATAARYGMNR